jgi:hypothetical protein
MSSRQVHSAGLIAESSVPRSSDTPVERGNHGASLEHLVAAATSVLAAPLPEHPTRGTAAAAVNGTSAVIDLNSNQQTGTFVCDLCGYITAHRGHFNRHRVGKPGVGMAGGCEAKHGRAALRQLPNL